MRLRTKKRRQQTFEKNIEDEDKDYSDFVRSLEKDPLGDLLNEELKQKMDIAIKQLPENYRTTFVLKDIEGLSLKEIAEMLDVSIPAVKSNLHRARIVLRNKLAEMWN